MAESGHAQLFAHGVFEHQTQPVLAEGEKALYGIRYHIITLIAVFLALGLGLLLGGTLGEEVIVKEQVQLLEQLDNLYTQTKSDNSKLHKQSSELKQRTEQLQQAMQQMGHHYVQDRLAGKKVAILHLEPLDLSPMMTVLQKSGAEVTSILSEQDVRGRLQESKEITVNRLLGSKPDAVILIGGASDHSISRLQKLDLPLLRALRGQGVMVVGVEASDVLHSAIRYYRELSDSTVDNIDQVTGMIALIDTLSGAKGNFGIKKSAEALLPKSTTAKEVTAQ